MSSLEKNPSLPDKDQQLPYEVLEAIIANTADAVLALSSTGRILVLNKEAEKLYDTSSQEAVGHLFAEVCLLEEKLDVINDMILETVQKPNELLNEDVAVTFAETQKHFNVRTRLLMDIKGQKRLGLIVVISDISQRIAATRERAESGMFMFTIISALLVAMTVNGLLLKAYPSLDIYSKTFGWIYTAIICAPVFAYMLWMKKPLSQYGWTLYNWRQSLKESILISASLFFTGLFVLMILAANDNKTVADFINFDWLDLSQFTSYSVHSILQELVFRGIVLGALVHMFRDYPQWLALLISSLLFGFMHMHFGLTPVVLTFIIGFLFGWLYLRHKTIIGVSVVHIVLGYSAFFFGLI